MAGQAPSRRQLLQALACASLASGAPGFSRWAFAFAEPQAAHAHHPSPAASSGHHKAAYVPAFFSAAEYRTLATLAQLILPGTPHPSGRPATSANAGATDAGVAEFIDFMVAHDPTLQATFRPGLAWIDTAAAPGKFVGLTPAQQNTLLQRLAYKKNFRPDETSGQEFFATMRRYTVMGFYTSRIGLESLDYPGLRFYAESPSVPNDGSLAQLGVLA